MLREVVARQPRHEPRRRWFSSDDFDLIVWFDDLDAIAGFTLCYDRSDVERALTWSRSRGYGHWRVDSGDDTSMKYGMTPILVPDNAEFPKGRVLAAFAEAANALEPTIRSFVVERLQAFPRERRNHEHAVPPPADLSQPLVTEHDVMPGRDDRRPRSVWLVIIPPLAFILALAVLWQLSK